MLICCVCLVRSLQSAALYNLLIDWLPLVLFLYLVILRFILQDSSKSCCAFALSCKLLVNIYKAYPSFHFKLIPELKLSDLWHSIHNCTPEYNHLVTPALFRMSDLYLLILVILFGSTVSKKIRHALLFFNAAMVLCSHDLINSTTNTISHYCAAISHICFHFSSTTRRL